MSVHSLKHCALLGMILIGASLSAPVAAQSHTSGAGHSVGSARGSGPRSGGTGWHGGGRPRSGGWRGYEGPHDGGWHRGGPTYWWGLGLGLGLGWDAWHYAPPYYDYPYPGYYVPAVPPAVIIEPRPAPETTEVPQNPPATSNWYYCESAKAYYPYVRQCPEPWRIVPPVPPGSGQ